MKRTTLTCYYDYTCNYSLKVLRWLDEVLAEGGEVDISWKTFSLKEANRDEWSVSPFDDPEISSLSVLALALAHAARGADLAGYHHRAFELFHTSDHRVEERALLDVAADAGVDIEEFDADRSLWLRAVAEEHAQAKIKWGVFGTPTLLIGEDAAVFLKLSEVPKPEPGALALWQSLCTISLCHPELIEIKRP